MVHDVTDQIPFQLDQSIEGKYWWHWYNTMKVLFPRKGGKIRWQPVNPGLSGNFPLKWCVWLCVHRGWCNTVHHVKLIQGGDITGIAYTVNDDALKTTQQIWSRSPLYINIICHNTWHYRQRISNENCYFSIYYFNMCSSCVTASVVCLYDCLLYTSDAADE